MYVEENKRVVNNFSNVYYFKIWWLNEIYLHVFFMNKNISLDMNKQASIMHT